MESLEIILRGSNTRELNSYLSTHQEDVNVRALSGLSPLLFTCYQCLVHSDDNIDEKVKILLKYGADVNSRGVVKLPGHGDSSLPWIEVTPLYLASYSKQFSVVQALLTAGARVNDTTSHLQTALHAACAAPVLKGESVQQAPDIIKLLLKEGAHVNARDMLSRTPIYHLVSLTILLDTSIFKLLQEYGALISIVDNRGLNLLEYAADTAHLSVVEYLLRNGSWNIDDMANAYELLGQHFRGRSGCYTMLCRATNLRNNKHQPCPKRILEPMACYGNVPEWQTMQELSAIQHAEDYLHRQCHIARERIFNNRYISLSNMTLFMSRAADVGDPRFHPLVLRQIQLFHRNKDYALFAETFVGCEKQKCALLLQEIDKYDLKPVFFSLALECCDKIRDNISSASTACCKMNAIEAFEKTVLVALHIIQSLQKKQAVKEMVTRLSSVCCLDLNGYKTSLLHIYLGPAHDLHWKLATDLKSPNPELLLSIIESQDINVMDSENNIPLHRIIASAIGNENSIFSQLININRGEFPVETDVESVKGAVLLLLRQGVHFDMKNKRGRTALDLCKDTASPLATELHEFLLQNAPFVSLKCLTSKMVKSGRLDYARWLPRTLTKFVDLH